MEDETTEKIFVSQEWYPQDFIELVPSIIIELMKSTPWKWKKKLKRWLSKS